MGSLSKSAALKKSAQFDRRRAPQQHMPPALAVGEVLTHAPVGGNVLLPNSGDCVVESGSLSNLITLRAKRSVGFKAIPVSVCPLSRLAEPIKDRVD